jgi:NAD+ synthase
MSATYEFDAAAETENAVKWIADWLKNKSGNADGIVLGISGGTDSSVVAGLCCEAVGSGRVRGVLMPNGHQPDIADAYRICGILGIKYNEINIAGAFEDVSGAIAKSGEALTHQAKINLAPRLRMAAVYALGQSINYRVAGAGNLSEAYVGYCTKWGVDMACDFAPIADFTKTEVISIGGFLNLPYDLVHKTPADGLSGLSDEENMKITYAVLDRYIRTSAYEPKDAEMIERIVKMNLNSRHKLNPVPHYQHLQNFTTD